MVNLIEAQSPKNLPLSPAENKAHSGCLTRMLSSVGANIRHFAVWGAKSICLQGDIEAENEVALKRLAEMTNSNHFQVILPGIAKKSFRRMEKQYEAGLAKTILNEERATIESIIMNVFAKMFINIGEQLRKEQPEAKINALSILTRLNKLINLNIQIAKLPSKGENVDISKEEKLKLDHDAMLNAFDMSMKTALPKGAHDLPFRFYTQDLVWKKLRAQSAPKLLIYSKILGGYEILENLGRALHSGTKNLHSHILKSDIFNLMRRKFLNDTAFSIQKS